MWARQVLISDEEVRKSTLKIPYILKFSFPKWLHICQFFQKLLSLFTLWTSQDFSLHICVKNCIHLALYVVVEALLEVRRIINATCGGNKKRVKMYTNGMTLIVQDYLEHVFLQPFSSNFPLNLIACSSLYHMPMETPPKLSAFYSHRPLQLSMAQKKI